MQVGDFYWRVFPEYDARVEHPALRQPISLIVDDPTPGYNPAYFHSGFLHGPAHVPPDLIDRFADLVEDTGIRGKFSVLPYPFGFGRVDREVQGVSHADVQHFLDVVRARIAPALDVTPEALTHWNALDLRTGQLLPYWEHVWSRGQTRETLTPYLTLAHEILNNVDLPCSGMTSPWDFGDGVEEEYAEAILAAQRAVHGRSFAWYFLQMDGTSRHVPPRLTVFRPERAEAVVSIVACDTYDFGRAVWRGGEPDPDVLISADGRRGRLAETLAAGGPVAFHTHWQTMFSQGSFSGLHALGELAARVGDHFGARVTWTNCDYVARYAAATAGFGMVTQDGNIGDIDLYIRAPFACPRFTISLACTSPVRGVRLDARPLTRVLERDSLVEGSYLLEGDRLILCWGLADGQRLSIERG